MNKVCVCGDEKGDHRFSDDETHVESTWDGSCHRFRPVLDWPDSEGLWWCSVGEMVNAIHLRHDGCDGFIVSSFLEDNDRESFTELHGPASFTKLLESNPFTESA